MNDPDDPAGLDAVALGVRYRARTLSPVEVTDAVLARMDRLEPAVRAFFTRTDDLARAEAAASEGRFTRGEPLGPMDGVPYSIKDFEATAGIRTTGAAPRYRDRVPDYDSVVAGRLRASGGVLLGKTSGPDAGHKDSSENLLFPATTNPWDHDRTPGGSSSGAAAAVAAGFGPLAQGSDGAGSIRIPAALCGVVGLKPTVGRVPVWPTSSAFGTMVHNGPLARTVADVALMLDVMAGRDWRDPLSDLPLPEGGFAGALAMPARRGLSLALSIDLGYGATAPEVERLVTEAAEALASAGGHRLERRDPGFDDPGAAQEERWSSTMAWLCAERLASHPEEFEPGFRELIEEGSRLPASAVWAFEATRSMIHGSLAALFQDVDYLLTPSMPITAWERGTSPTTAGGRDLPRGGILRRAYLLWPFNLTGNPAVTVPCGLDRDGLPVGIQVVGRLGDDLGVLRVAAVLEAGIGFTSRPSLQSPVE